MTTNAYSDDTSSCPDSIGSHTSTRTVSRAASRPRNQRRSPEKPTPYHWACLFCITDVHFFTFHKCNVVDFTETNYWYATSK